MKLTHTQQKIAVIGLGREGKSILKYLAEHRRILHNPEITVLDQKLNRRELPRAPRVKSRSGPQYLASLSAFDVVFRSPGIPYRLKEIKAAIKHGVKFSSATRLFFDAIKELKAKSSKLTASSYPQIIGVTGTKGKGTVATLIYQILKNSGKRTMLAGNIGIPMLEVLPKAQEVEYIVLELSSFQLQDLEMSPDIAVILDITPDHLDQHKDLREYINAKARITRFQTKNDNVFYFSDQKRPKVIARKSKAKKMAVSSKNFRLFEQRDLKILGPHNFRNAVMAARVTETLGCDPMVIRETVSNFSGNPHRLELVREMFHPSSHHIRFYDDSASTTPEPAAAAIRSFKEAIILIAGGRSKVRDYHVLADALRTSTVQNVILIGENKLNLKTQLKQSGKSTVIAPTLESAVELAYLIGKKIRSGGNSCEIIFSPASTSFDMFKDYADRGEQFKKIVQSLR